MKIKILTSCAGLDFSFSAGETVDTDDTTAKDLVRAGHAKAATEKPETPPEDPPKGAETNGKGDDAASSGTGKAG